MREYLLALPQVEIVVIDNGCKEDTAVFAPAVRTEVMTERRRGKTTAVVPCWPRSTPSSS